MPGGGPVPARGGSCVRGAWPVTSIRAWPWRAVLSVLAAAVVVCGGAAPASAGSSAGASPGTTPGGAQVPGCHGVAVTPDQAADLPTIVAGQPPGTTFCLAPGDYRIPAPIQPLDGDVLNGSGRSLTTGTVLRRGRAGAGLDARRRAVPTRGGHRQAV